MLAARAWSEFGPCGTRGRALEHANVRAHVYAVRTGINHDCIHRRIRQCICSSPGNIAPIHSRICGPPHVSRAAGEPHHSNVIRVASWVRSVNRHAGDRELVGIDAAATGTIQRDLGECRSRARNCNSIRRGPNISAGRGTQIAWPKPVRGGIDYLRAICIRRPSGGQSANHVNLISRAGPGAECLEIKAERGECAARSRPLPHPARPHQQRTGGLRVENIGEVKRPIVAANIATADDHREAAVIAVRSGGTLLNIKVAAAGWSVWVRCKPVAGVGIEGVVAAIAREDVSPTQARRRGCGCRRTIILRASENSVGIGGMLGEADELSHRTQVLIEIVELIGAGT